MGRVFGEEECSEAGRGRVGGAGFGGRRRAARRRVQQVAPAHWRRGSSRVLLPGSERHAPAATRTPAPLPRPDHGTHPLRGRKLGGLGLRLRGLAVGVIVQIDGHLPGVVSLLKGQELGQIHFFRLVAQIRHGPAQRSDEARASGARRQHPRWPGLSPKQALPPPPPSKPRRPPIMTADLIGRSPTHPRCHCYALWGVKGAADAGPHLAFADLHARLAVGARSTTGGGPDKPPQQTGSPLLIPSTRLMV